MCWWLGWLMGTRAKMVKNWVWAITLQRAKVKTGEPRHWWIGFEHWREERSWKPSDIKSKVISFHLQGVFSQWPLKEKLNDIACRNYRLLLSQSQVLLQGKKTHCCQSYLRAPSSESFTLLYMLPHLLQTGRNISMNSSKEVLPMA